MSRQRLVKPSYRAFCSAIVTKKDGSQIILSDNAPNLLTNNGRDFYHDQCLVALAAANTRGAHFIAVTESTITPAVGNTTLTGEITTNGLARADASAGAPGVITHTTGTNSTTIEYEFTVVTSGFTDVKASALFNSSSGGIMTHIANFSNGGSGTLAVEDKLKVIWTINIG